jgi:predicted kinase
MESFRERLLEEWPRAVTVICGHPCCLKTTVTQNLTSQYELFGIFTHQMGRIRAMWDEPFEQQRGYRYERILHMARAAMECGLPIVVEGTFERAVERGMLTTLARANSYSVIFVYVYASNSTVVLARFRHRGNLRYGPDHRANDEAIYFDSVKRFEPLGPIETAVYDAYAEVDSVSKTLTNSRSSDATLSDVLHAVGECYRDIAW